MREHIVNVPTNDERIEFVLDPLTGNAKTEVRMRPSDMKESADDILRIIEETFKILDNIKQLGHNFMKESMERMKVKNRIPYL